MKKVAILVVVAILLTLTISSFVYAEETEEYNVKFGANNYGCGSTTNVTVKNTSTKVIRDWKLSWNFSGKEKIINLWCGKYKQTENSVEVTPMEWNKEIAPGASITFGFSADNEVGEPQDILLDYEGKIVSNNEITVDKKLISANTKFAFDIFKQINNNEKGSNVFISPFSISDALTMLYQGARADTRAELSKVLNYDELTIETINEQYKELLMNLNNIDEKVELNIANSIWLRDTFIPNPEFIETNVDVFNAEVESLDFRKSNAKDIINEWVSNATNDKINNVLSSPIPEEMMMYLINAIYFKGDWTTPFDSDYTSEKSFTLESGDVKTVDMMRRSGSIDYGKGSDYSAIRLPYGDGKISMYCVLPEQESSIDSLIDSLDAEKFAAIKDSISLKPNVDVLLPKFKVEFGLRSLIKELNSMGMKKSFTESADFTGIAENLFVSEVGHKAVIDVNEEGSEAAAVTIIGVGVTAYQEPTKFHANRPFLYFIVDDLSGSILFMGKSADLDRY